ncbi:hypothetical protein GCM10010271_01090 [Streptomyces kurssanovii]|nr:hypothetical protein GCM10010271_01090 [Streptomyces kurssanovii]
MYALSHAKLHLMHDDVLLQQLSAALHSSPQRNILGFKRQQKSLGADQRELAALTLHAAYQRKKQKELFAAAVAGAVSLKGVRGTSGPYHVATGLIILRLPVGALTAVAGILLMSGEFLPGLTNLDTSTQVCAWAFAFGVLQESVTRAVDRQGQHLIDNVKAPGSNVGDAEKEKGGKARANPGTVQ